MKKLITLLFLVFPITGACTEFVLKHKERSGGITYSYYKYSMKNGDRYIRVDCNPDRSLSVKVCSKLTRSTYCYKHFNYQFDKDQVQTVLYDQYGRSKAWDWDFVQKMKSHNKLLLQPIGVVKGRAIDYGFDMSSFNLKGVTAKLKEFRNQCNLPPKQTIKHTPKLTQANSTPKKISNVHYHGEKKHEHVFPKSNGVAHRHRGIESIGRFLNTEVKSEQVEGDNIGWSNLKPAYSGSPVFFKRKPKKKQYLDNYRGSSSCHYVGGYYRRSGTYVRGYMRCR